jgi:hypothetical protein
MAANKKVRFGPVALSLTTTTNIINPPTISGGAGVAGANTGTYLLVTHLRVVNKTNVAASFGLWLGATGANAAGTEVIAGAAASAGALTAGTGISVAANSYFDWFGQMRMDVADFLVGGAGTATALTIEGEGEIGVA